MSDVFADSVASPRIQEQLRDLRRQLDRERGMRLSLENRRQNMESEKTDLLQWVHLECLQIVFFLESILQWKRIFFLEGTQSHVCCLTVDFLLQKTRDRNEGQVKPWAKQNW